jgi:transcription-repair coupling factor (superfamily II helicase)
MADNLIIGALRHIGAFGEMDRAIKNGQTPIYASGLSGVHRAHFIAGLCDNRPVFAVCESEAAAARLSADINVISGENVSAVIPSKETAYIASEAVSREYEFARIGALSNILSGKLRVVCASAESVMQKTLPPEKLRENTLSLHAGGAFGVLKNDFETSENAAGDTGAQEAHAGKPLFKKSSVGSYDTIKLSEKLSAMGYVRVDRVGSPSQFAKRGDIFDIFPVSSALPIRIEFFGDEIDTISTFDIESQRRIDTIKEISIPPAREVLFASVGEQIRLIETLINRNHSKNHELIVKNFERDILRLRDFGDGYILGNIDKYLPLAYENPATVLDFLSPETAVILCEEKNIAAAARGVFAQYKEDSKELLQKGEFCRGIDNHLIEFERFSEAAERFPLVFMNSFAGGGGKVLKRLINVKSGQTAAWGGELHQLEEDLRVFSGKDSVVFVLAGSDKTLPIICSDLVSDGFNAEIMTSQSVFQNGKIYLRTGALSGGFNYPDEKIALITQGKAQSSQKRVEKRAKKGGGIASLSDIRPGDLVVHNTHGIGRFMGINKLEIEGVTKDYITIAYSGADRLHVPVGQLDLVSRYIGPGDNETVKLSRLGNDDWAKRKARVKKAVEDMAEELAALYAKRAKTPGFPFPSDDDFQNDFERRFPYAETDDQLRSTAEIKADMERAVPMDRLLCGDVGFGKTEVAFRAAFKCIEAGKQCVILAPTTVLAWQHYQTALSRFENFPFRIGLLSRFLKPKERKTAKELIADGKCDLIIGTHMLIQKGVKYTDLGLVIIDEEQRFGVAHKERFKTIFAGVDVLTLSATPIPRTLNMAMSGIRDMSVLEEAPVDRHPVQTYVIEFDEDIVRQAIVKELRRGGQVYYIHNRVESISRCAERIRELVPEARIGIAHGKMEEDDLSEIWRQLLENEIDILICTTLIETGVDVQNCNTLIIEDSDRFGLSQLYQLRGRVGRSARRASAYFTFRRGKNLTEIASKRLEAIREFTQFGSGFRIAMRDLEIRGAGSVLGGNQHGHLESVGYDMYLQILSQVMAAEKGEVVPDKTDCLVDLKIEAHIPEGYIPSLADRLDIYRKIAELKTAEDASDLTDELIDRFGDPPRGITGLITVSLVRNRAARIGITEITQRGAQMLFFIKEASPEQIANCVKTLRGRVTVNAAPPRPFVSVKIANEPPEKLMEIVIDALGG